MKKHRLIPDDAQKLLNEQDAARAKARVGTEEERAEAFRRSFASGIFAEIHLVRKWGYSADMAGGEVVRSITAKYPPRKLSRFEQFLNKHFTRKDGVPVFQFEPRVRGFLFNEGGRGVTFTSIPTVRFRLYVAGVVLDHVGGKWRVWRKSPLRSASR